MDRRSSSWLSAAVLVLLTEAVYFRRSVWRAGLFGADFDQLHSRHIAFARQALLGPGHALPGWYPSELLGAPFAANLQSFPWIPTRLLLLLLDSRHEYAAAVAIAAALAAIFTYLYCRRLGLSELGSVSTGWTFACSGYFASRVMAGHLPMLEAYPALPLLLWLADRSVAADRARYRVRDLFLLALAAACTALAGHPQLPVYSLGAALAYLIFLGRGRRRILAVVSLALGVAATSFAWWPMILLIERSTRVLPLAASANDIAMPFGRVLALLLPGRDGWPEVVGKAGEKLFSGYPNAAYFWDTASYLGLLPWLAILLLLVRSFARKRLPAPPFAFLSILGIAALLLSLPAAQPLHHFFHGTFLRSPARLLYLSTFCASVGLGCGLDALWRSQVFPNPIRLGILAALLALHAADLGGFARVFIQPAVPDPIPSEFEEILSHALGDARIAAEDSAYRNRYDDAGIFDSILLANPYRALLALAGLPPDYNEQRLDASAFPLRALQATGVRFVITSDRRSDLELVRSSEQENLYRVPDSAPRAALVTEPSVPVTYRRPSSDEIRLEVTAARPGLARVLESYDPGWTATLDAGPAPVVLADGFVLAVPVTPGRHSIVLGYQTPGRRFGYLLTLASIALIIGLLRIGAAQNCPP